MKLKITYGVFLFMVFSGIPIRLLQLLNDIDPLTGFFESQGWTVWGLRIVLVLGSVALYLLPRVHLAGSVHRRTDLRVPGIAAIVFGLLSVYSASLSIYRCVIGALGEPLAPFWMVVLEFVFEWFSGIVLLLHGITLLGKESESRWMPYALVIPIFWLVFKLCVIFMNNTTILPISSILLEFFTTIFALLFIFHYARLFLGIRVKKSQRCMITWGYIGAAFGLISTVPDFIMMFLDNMSLTDFLQTADIQTFALSLLMMLFAFFLVSDQEKEEWERPAA